MKTISGSNVVRVASQSRLRYANDRQEKLDEAINILNREGKKVVNIIDGPLQPFGPLGNVFCDVTILWEKTEENTVINDTKADVISVKPDEKANVIVTSENFASILSRIDLFLEDNEWDKAKSYCDAALDYNSTSPEVYLRLVLAENKLSKIEELTIESINDRNFQKALRFAEEPLKSKLDALVTTWENEKHYSELINRLSTVNGNEGVRLIEADEDKLTEEEITELLHCLSNTFTEKVKKLSTPDSVFGISDTRVYSSEKLNDELTLENWNYFIEHGVNPIDSSMIPTSAAADYDAIISWVADKVQVKVDREQYLKANPLVAEMERLTHERVRLKNDLSEAEKKLIGLRYDRKEKSKNYSGLMVFLTIMLAPFATVGFIAGGGWILMSIVAIIIWIGLVYALLIKPPEGFEEQKEILRKTKERLSDIENKIADIDKKA